MQTKGRSFSLLTAVSLGATLLMPLSAFAQAGIGKFQAVPAVGTHTVLAHPQQTNFGRPAPEQPLHLTFILNSSRRKDMDAFIASQNDPASPNYHHWLTPEQVGEKFGASQADVNTVVRGLQQQGLTVTNVWSNHLYVSADATVAQAERAFNIKLEGFNRPQELVAKGDPATYYAPNAKPALPAALAQRVQGIFGLSNFILPHSGFRHKFIPQQNGVIQSGARAAGKPGAGPSAIGGPTPMFSGPLGPADIAKVYNVDALHAANLWGQNQKIAIWSPTLVHLSDLTLFKNNFGITGVPTPLEVFTNSRATNYNGEGEANLDMDVIVGQAPNVQISLYEDGNVFDAFLKIQQDNTTTISCSWGFEDWQFAQSDMDQFEQMAQPFATQGQALYASSGDDGPYDRSTKTKITVNWPACSAYATGVGGTTLPNDDNGNWKSELGWWTGTGGAGGGICKLIARPSWQAGPGVANTYSTGKRQVPDVSALAYAPYYDVFSGGQEGGYYGTSASTPLWAVVHRLIEQGKGSKLGNLNPYYYMIGTKLNDDDNIFVFHDITVGGITPNGGTTDFYHCTDKWDYLTGWGSADFGKLYFDITQNPNLKPYKPTTNLSGTWTSPLMIHKLQTDVTEPATFNSTDTYYFGVAIVDDVNADALPAKISIQIDGVDSKFQFGATPSGYYLYNVAVASAKFTPGTHTIKLIADVDKEVSETNETDNVYSRTITVTGTTALSIASVALNPTSVTGGQTSTGTVTLSAAAPTGGQVVTLASSNTSVATVSASVTVAAGATSATFTVTSKTVAANATASITATLGSSSKSATLTVTPASTVAISAVTVLPGSVVGGQNALGKITLSGPAPAGGAVITLSGNNAAVGSVPASITVAAGATTKTFLITTQTVASPFTFVIKATYAGASKGGVLGVYPNSVTFMAFSPKTIEGGLYTALTITLRGPAGAGGATVTLTNTNATGITVPTSIVVPSGASAITLLLSTNLTATNQTATVTATLNSVSKSDTVTITP